MITVTREHLEDEVLKSIQKKAESIMPKDAKVIFRVKGQKGCQGRFRLGHPCASEQG